MWGCIPCTRRKNRCERYVLLNRIPRSRYLAGKFFGTTVILALFLACSSAAVFLLVRVVAGVYAFEIFVAALWTLVEFSLVMAVGILFYCLETGFSLNAMMVIAVYGVGHSIRETLLSFQGLGRYGSQLYYTLVKVVAVVFPDFDFFNFRLALIHHEPVPAGKILVSRRILGLLPGRRAAHLRLDFPAKGHLKWPAFFLCWQNRR